MRHLLTVAHTAIALTFAISQPVAAVQPADMQARMNDLTAEWEVDPTPILKGFHNLYNPNVVYEPGSDYPLKMWFFGWALQDVDPRWPGDVVFFARAKSLHAWEVYAGKDRWQGDTDASKYVPVMVPPHDKPLDVREPYDGMANGDPSVVRKDGVYYMALSSVGFQPRRDASGKTRLYLINCVLGASSRDGIHWQKTSAPIAIWKNEFTNSQEIVEGQAVCPPDYYGSYHRPSLMFDEGKWKLWFDYYVPGTFLSMGYAENTGEFCDSSQWRVVRAEKEPVLRDWPNPSVVKAKGTYYSFSDASKYPKELGGDTRQLTMATSPDGLGWTICGHIRPHGCESSHVPQAIAMEEAGKTWLYVFYSWKPAQRPNEPPDYRYKELRYMRTQLP